MEDKGKLVCELMDNKYDKLWQVKQSPYKPDFIYEGILKLARRYTDGLTLDIGAGDGSLVMAYKKQGGRIDGIDLAPKHPLILYGDCRKLKYADGVYETIFAIDILEHLDDEGLNECLNEVYRVLCENGRLIITTSNDEDIKAFPVVCPECGCQFHRVGHQQRFTEHRIIGILKNHGFRIVKLRKLNLGFFSMFGVFGKLFYLLGLQKRFNAPILTKDLFIVCEK